VTTCFLCAQPAPLFAVMPIDAKTYQPTTHGRIHRCPACALGFVFPRPSPAETNTFYELEAYYTQGRSHMPDMRPTFLAKVRGHLAWRADHSEPILEVLGRELKPDSAVADVGCGSGTLLRELAKMGHRAIGIERDAAALSRNGELQVIEGTAEQLPDIEPADAVVFSHVLEHLVDPVDALRRAAALLKPGGLLVVEVPNNQALIARRSGLAWEHLDIPRHINFFAEASLKATVQAAGYEVQRSYFAGYCRYFSRSFVATEQRIFDHLGRAGPAVRNSELRSWLLLGETAFAQPQAKYDSVGVVAKR
jgi:SAM-dependent methyltransferase